MSLFELLKPPNTKYRESDPNYNDYDWDVLCSKELGTRRQGHCIDKTNYAYNMAKKFDLPKPKVFYVLDVFEKVR